MAEFPIILVVIAIGAQVATILTKSALIRNDEAELLFQSWVMSPPSKVIGTPLRAVYDSHKN